MSNERFKLAKKATLIGAIANALLGFIKLFTGLLFHSHALVADAFHSFADIITDTMVLVAAKYGSQDADDSHPYGHQRFETAATLLLALLLILTGIGIAWDGINELVMHRYSASHWQALFVAFLSIIVNELLFHYTQAVAKKINSQLLKANAWHHRSDAASSVVVALGLIASLLGYVYFDILAAIIIGVMIVKMGVSYGFSSVKELVDTAVEQEVLIKIETIINSFEDVIKIHQLRTRLMGGDIYIDLHILVSPFISVSEGHFIAQQVHYVLMKKLDRVKDVIVHVDPEDDEESSPSLTLANRGLLEQRFLLSWQQEFPSLSHWNIHYIGGRIILDLFYKNTIALQPLTQRIEEDLKEFSMIEGVYVYKEETYISVKIERTGTTMENISKNNSG